MAKDPAFLFYSADFMMGALLLTMEERGQYITLLAVMHQQGRLSNEEVEVLIKKKPSTKLAAKFKIDENGHWYNERLEAEASKRSKFIESRQNSLDITNEDMVNIYLMHDPMTGKYKIGSSKYPMLRLTDMQKKNPAIIMYWVSPVLVKRILEKELHTEYKSKKFKNDWFSLSEEDIDSIINKKEFRTDKENDSRTVLRTVNENLNENEIQVFGNIKESFVSIKKVFAADKPKRIYDLQKYFDYTGQLETFKRAGMDKFDEFMQANPANVFEDPNHLYNTFRKFCLDGHLRAAAKGKKATTEDIAQWQQE